MLNEPETRNAILFDVAFTLNYTVVHECRDDGTYPEDESYYLVIIDQVLAKSFDQVDYIVNEYVNDYLDSLSNDSGDDIYIDSIQYHYIIDTSLNYNREELEENVNQLCSA